MPPAVVFPGQGSQLPGAGLPWLDHPAWRVVEQAEEAPGVPLAPLLLDADADLLAAPATPSCRCCSPSLVVWEAARDPSAPRSPSPATRSARSPP